MRKKSGFTIVEQAIVLVPEFENVVRKMDQQVTLRGLDIPVILTPHSGHIDPPNEIMVLRMQRTDNITVFFLSFHLLTQFDRKHVPIYPKLRLQ